MRDYKPTYISWDICNTTKDMTPQERGIFLSNRNKALADLLEASIAYIVEKVPVDTLRSDFHATVMEPSIPVHDAKSFAKMFDEETRSTVIGEAWSICEGNARTAEQAAEYTAQLFDRLLDQYYETLHPSSEG